MTSADFIHPVGELTQEMFPGETLADNIDAWITESATKSSDATARAAWVYHRAFKTVANRFYAEAMDVSIEDQVSRKRVLGQAKYWEGRSDQSLDGFLAATSQGAAFGIRASASDRTFNDTTLGVDTYGGFV